MTAEAAVRRLRRYRFQPGPQQGGIAVEAPGGVVGARGERIEVEAPGACIEVELPGAWLMPGGQRVVALGGMLEFGMLLGLLLGVLGPLGALPVGCALAASAAAPRSIPHSVADNFMIPSLLGFRRG